MELRGMTDSLREVRKMFINASLEPSGYEFTSSANRLLDVRGEGKETEKERTLQLPCYAYWANMYVWVKSLNLKSLSSYYDDGGLAITDAALLRSIFHVPNVLLSLISRFFAQYNASLLGIESIEELLANFTTIVEDNDALLKHYRARFDDVFMKVRRIFTIFDTDRCVKANKSCSEL